MQNLWEQITRWYWEHGFRHTAESMDAIKKAWEWHPDGLLRTLENQRYAPVRKERKEHQHNRNFYRRKVHHT